jgi:Arc/MetJ-type ribon-helix-helix transcriptional regulator
MNTPQRARPNAADRHKPTISGSLHARPPRNYVPITISLSPAIKQELDAIAAERCRGSWRGAVKYSDVIREGIDLVLKRERAAKEAAAKLDDKRDGAALSGRKGAPKRKAAKR